MKKELNDLLLELDRQIDKQIQYNTPQKQDS